MSLEGEDQLSGSSQAIKVLIFLIPLGLAGIVIYSLQSLRFASVMSISSVGMMIGGASLLCGGLVGFLFGIPRTLQKDPHPSKSEERGLDENGAVKASYEANTNLEQISDWLTKIIVGVGLTQITVIPGKLQGMAEYAAEGLGGFNGGKTFAMVIILFYFVCGFLFGYLWTRLFLASELDKADNSSCSQVIARSIATLDVLEPKLSDNEKASFQTFRQEAEKELAALLPKAKVARQQLPKFAQAYERLRQSMRSGSERTVQMGTILAQVRALSQKTTAQPDYIKKLFESGADGSRIVALGLLQVVRYPECIDIVIKAISDPRSAFEQYQALRLAEDMLPSLTEENKKRLVEVLLDQRSGNAGKFIEQGSDRWQLSDRILNCISPQGAGAGTKQDGAS